MTQVRNTPAIIDAVRMQQFDIGIVGRSPPYEGVEVLFETSFRYVCLQPDSHPLLAKGQSVDLEAIAESENVITFGGAFPDDMMAMDHQLSQKLRENSRLSAVSLVLPHTKRACAQNGQYRLASLDLICKRFKLVTQQIEVAAPEHFSDLLLGRLRLIVNNPL